MLPGLLVALWWRRLWANYDLICLYLLLVAFEAVVSVVLAQLVIFNHWLIIPVVVGNTVLIASIFLANIHHRVFNNLTWMAVGLVIMAIVGEFYTFGASNQFYPFGTTLQSVFCMALCLVYFYRFREDELIINPYRELHFWFAAGLIVQFGLTILVNLFSKAALVAWEQSQEGSFIYALLKVRYLASIIGQAFIIFGLWQHRSIPSPSST